MPADILGSEVLEESESGRRSFRFIPGPVFCQLLMADEINRASPRTQSALLQAMQEGRVSIAGQYHPLPQPFHVLATQNPLEQEGTYPLPEAQLDRFLLQIDVDYPDRRRRAGDADRDHRLGRGPAARGDERRRADRRRSAWCAAFRSARAWSRRSSPLVRAGRPETARPATDARAPCRVGAGAARQPGADAGLPGAGAARRPLQPVGRRCRGAGAAGAAAPHGAQLCRARRGRHGGSVIELISAPFGEFRRAAAARVVLARHGPPRGFAARPGRAEPRCCRRCWSRPSASPPTWRRACTDAAASGRAKPSGNSANTAGRRAAASTGARAPSRSASMSAKPNGRPRKACGCGATTPPRWIGDRCRACR